MDVKSKLENSDKNPKIAVLLVIILIALTIIGATQLNYDNSEPVDHQASYNLSQNLTCLNQTNYTVCYTEENKSDVNITRLIE